MTKFYLVVLGDMVVGKRAIGPDEHGAHPSPPADTLEVSKADYFRVGLRWTQNPGGQWVPPQKDGRPDTAREAQARTLGLLRKAQQALVALDERVTRLENQVALLRSQ